MTVTLGYRDPETLRDFVVEVGLRDEERGGYWAIELGPHGESIGNVFFAEDASIAAHGTPNPITTWQAAAELARSAHHLAAGQDDSKLYARSQKAFKAAIHAAYPDLDYRGVYGVWIDCMESVAYCAGQFRSMDRETRRRFVAMGS